MNFFLLSMKNNAFLREIGLALVLIVLVVLFSQPLQQLWMPTMFRSLIPLGLVIAFLVFAVFIWHEQPKDEREEQQRLFAGRVSFLAGVALLVGGIIVQTIQHRLDSWLLVTLVGMVVAKLSVRFIDEFSNR